MKAETKQMTKAEIIQWMKDAYVMIGEKNSTSEDEGKSLLGGLIDILEKEEKEPEYKYVWLSMPDGGFSNSWNEQDQKIHGEDIIKYANGKESKLLKYQCLTDSEFEFYNKMKLR